MSLDCENHTEFSTVAIGGLGYGMPTCGLVRKKSGFNLLPHSGPCVPSNFVSGDLL